MLLKQVNNKWIVFNYNYFTIHPITNELNEEWKMRDYYKNKIKQYCESGNYGNYPIHKFANFIDARIIDSIINNTKIALWEGVLEKRVTTYRYDYTDSVLITIESIEDDNDFEVRIETTEDNDIIEIGSISLDYLEFIENNKEYFSGINDGVAEEMNNKSNYLRSIVNKRYITNSLSNCDITFMADEGMLYLVQ